MFADTDLGNASDDYAGTDTTRSMAFAYNADDDDEGQNGYGTPPPAFGVDVLSGLYAAPRISKGGFAPTEEPHTAVAHYDRLRGLFTDGTPMREFGNGYEQAQGALTRFSFTGDPITRAFWSMPNPENNPISSPAGDQRLVIAGPPVTLAPGASTTLDIGMLFAQGASRLASVQVLRRVSDEVQGAYDAGSLFAGQIATGTTAAPTLVAPAENAYFYETPVTFSWDAVPGADSYVLEYSPDTGFSSIDLETASGTSVTVPASRFEPNWTDAQFWRVRSVRAGCGAAERSAVHPHLPVRAGGASPRERRSRLRRDDRARRGAGLRRAGRSGRGLCRGRRRRRLRLAQQHRRVPPRQPVGFQLRLARRVRATHVRDPVYRDRLVRLGGSASGVTTLLHVPFELWDIGAVPPRTPDGTADDVQLIPRLGLSRCVFDFDVTASLQTPQVAAHYPTGNDYAAFAALAAPLVAAAPTGCPSGGISTAVSDRIDFVRGLPLRRLRIRTPRAAHRRRPRRHDGPVLYRPPRRRGRGRTVGG